MSAVTPGTVTGRTAGQTAAPWPLVGMLVVLVFPLGLAALEWGRFGTDLAMWWPAAGVGVIAVCFTPRRHRLLVGLGVAVGGGLANLAFGREPEVAVLLGLATGTEAVVTGTLLTRNRDERPHLHGLDDLVRFLAAALGGAAVAGAFVAVGLQIQSGADPLITWRTVVASHVAAVVAITPLGLGVPETRRPARRSEATLQWIVLMIVVGLVFGPDQTLPLTFLLFVPLVWGAMRLGVRLVSWQVFATALVITTTTTIDWGPFAALAGSSPQVVAALSQAAVTSCALVALPLAVLKSQRSVAMEAASSSGELLDNILAAATSTAVIGTDLNGRIEFFNLGAEEISGWRADEVVGSASLAVVPPADGGADALVVTFAETSPDTVALEVLIEPFLAGTQDSTFRDDWVLQRRDGRTRTIAVTVSRRYDNGKPVGYVGIAEDVTDKRLEESYAAAALDAERQLVDRLAQVDRTKNDFMSTVSHELRTPITSILGYSQLLLSDETGALPVMHRQIVGRIERNGRRLLGLIEDMLTMSQVEVGDFRYAFQRCDLRSVVQGAVETEMSVFGTLGVQLTQDIVGEPLWVDADPDKLERALAALLDNAAKYSQPGDEVHLRVTRDEDAARIAVVDHGLGISEEDQEHLFDRFFRGSDAHARAIQGAGLGLSVTSMIVDGHSGSIACTSALGEGSTFTVTLPFAVEGASTAREAGAAGAAGAVGDHH